jgi:hypothetical protein
VIPIPTRAPIPPPPIPKPKAKDSTKSSIFNSLSPSIVPLKYTLSNCAFVSNKYLLILLTNTTIFVLNFAFLFQYLSYFLL